MSIERSYYVIAGFDLTGFETDKYDDWKWTDEGEKYSCNQAKGEIQLFEDPMSGSFLYLGYILSANDEYDFKTTKIGCNDFENKIHDVSNELNNLVDIGIISKDALNSCEFEVIVFEECS